MGLIALFKKWKHSKDIMLKQDISTYLVFPYKLKKGQVYLNKEAVVPENCLLAFSARNKLLDVLPTGNHTLGVVVLPKCSKKFKLYKKDRYGKEQKSFKCFVYYINTQPIENFNFSTCEYLKFNNSLDGKFKVLLDFVCTLKVQDPNRLFKSLFSEYSYFKQNEIENIVKMWAGEKVVGLLKKQTFYRKQFVYNNQIVIEKINTKLGEMFESVGLEMSCLNMDKILIPKNKHNEKFEVKFERVSETCENKEVVEQSNPSQISEEEMSMLNKMKEFDEKILSNTDEKNDWNGLEKFWKK